VVGSVIIAVAILLAVVYIKMSRALLEKSEDLLRTTMDMTLQEATAWMDQTLSMLETQRDAIEFSDMDVFT
ncbi:methyl-accepting chemotaxis protein, partial [Klebsiella oxytoca]